MHTKCSFRSQDSMLDFDGQSLDPAIVLAQPMKQVPSMEMPPMVCQPGMLIVPPHGHSVSLWDKHIKSSNFAGLWFLNLQLTQSLVLPSLLLLAFSMNPHKWV